MNKILPFFVFLLIPLILKAQDNSKNKERYPEFPNCKNLQFDALQNCFNIEVQNFVYFGP